MAAITTKDEAKAGQTAAEDSEPPPWHAAYPPPQNSNPASISRAELLQLLLLQYSSDGHENKNQTKKKDFVLIDLRRMDHEVSSVLDRRGVFFFGFFLSNLFLLQCKWQESFIKIGGHGG